jgi:hypothetical protein
LLEAGVHFFFLYQLAAIGLRDAIMHCGAEPGVFFQQAQGSVDHQMRSVHSRLAGDLRELRCLLGSEMYFHALKISQKLRGRNAGGR